MATFDTISQSSLRKSLDSTNKDFYGTKKSTKKRKIKMSAY